jgi:hypothetical protein
VPFAFVGPPYALVPVLDGSPGEVSVLFPGDAITDPSLPMVVWWDLDPATVAAFAVEGFGNPLVTANHEPYDAVVGRALAALPHCVPAAFAWWRYAEVGPRGGPALTTTCWLTDLSLAPVLQVAADLVPRRGPAVAAAADAVAAAVTALGLDPATAWGDPLGDPLGWLGPVGPPALPGANPPSVAVTLGVPWTPPSASPSGTPSSSASPTASPSTTGSGSRSRSATRSPSASVPGSVSRTGTPTPVPSGGVDPRPARPLPVAVRVTSLGTTTDDTPDPVTGFCDLDVSGSPARVGAGTWAPARAPVPDPMTATPACRLLLPFHALTVEVILDAVPNGTAGALQPAVDTWVSTGIGLGRVPATGSLGPATWVPEWAPGSGPGPDYAWAWTYVLPGFGDAAWGAALAAPNTTLWMGAGAEGLNGNDPALVAGTHSAVAGAWDLGVTLAWLAPGVDSDRAVGPRSASPSATRSASRSPSATRSVPSVRVVPTVLHVAQWAVAPDGTPADGDFPTSLRSVVLEETGPGVYAPPSGTVLTTDADAGVTVLSLQYGVAGGGAPVTPMTRFTAPGTGVGPGPGPPCVPRDGGAPVGVFQTRDPVLAPPWARGRAGFGLGLPTGTAGVVLEPRCEPGPGNPALALVLEALVPPEATGPTFGMDPARVNVVLGGAGTASPSPSPSPSPVPHARLATGAVLPPRAVWGDWDPVATATGAGAWTPLVAAAAPPPGFGPEPVAYTLPGPLGVACELGTSRPGPFSLGLLVNATTGLGLGSGPVFYFPVGVGGATGASHHTAVAAGPTNDTVLLLVGNWAPQAPGNFTVASFVPVPTLPGTTPVSTRALAAFTVTVDLVCNPL